MDAVSDGVVCFAGVDWWYHNRGHSECQIMTRLSRRVPVLWVNSIGMRAPSPGKTELVWRRYVRKLRSTIKGLRKDPSGMWVYSPIFIPRYTKRMVEINGILLALQVRTLCRALGMKKPAVWATVPTAAPAVERRAWTRTVFNRSDEFSAFPEADARFIAPLENRLLSKCDHVVYVNRVLFEREKGAVRDAQYIGHGVDYPHFAVRSKVGIPGEIPAQLAGLPRPFIGFYGALDNYTIDLDLMIKVARQVQGGTLVVIGPVAMDISRLVAEPNVTYLGPIPYAELPSYAAQFDVALMPWLRNTWIEGCNPIKLKEYLALGFPIVAMKFRELERYEHLVYAAGTHEEFLRAVDEALRETDPGLVTRRREAVQEESWDVLTDRVAGLLGVARSQGEKC